MSSLVCPFMSGAEAEKNCIEERCQLWAKGTTSSNCTFAKVPMKEVSRLDTLSSQLAEIQVVLNLMLDKNL